MTKALTFRCEDIVEAYAEKHALWLTPENKAELVEQLRASLPGLVHRMVQPLRCHSCHGQLVDPTYSEHIQEGYQLGGSTVCGKCAREAEER